MGKTTTNLRKAYDELSMEAEVLEEIEVYQLKMKKKHRNMKKKLIGYGNNRHSGGGKGFSKPNYDRSKSAPPMAEAIEGKNKKKIKIKVKKVQDIDEKRKKRRKKRKKSRKRRGYGGYYPYYDLYDGASSGDSGGDGGGE